MKLILQNPPQENCAFTLTLEYSVPARENTYCMSIYADREKALSLHKVLQLEDTSYELPSLLTFEPGDKILLFHKREIIIQKGFSLPTQLGAHEAIIFEIVSYYVAGAYLHYRQKDPTFFRAFDQTFSITGTKPFTREEINQNVIATDLFGNIETYFKIDPKTRQTFLTSTGAIP